MRSWPINLDPLETAAAKTYGAVSLAKAYFGLAMLSLGVLPIVITNHYITGDPDRWLPLQLVLSHLLFVPMLALPAVALMRASRVFGILLAAGSAITGVFVAVTAYAHVASMSALPARTVAPLAVTALFWLYVTSACWMVGIRLARVSERDRRLLAELPFDAAGCSAWLARLIGLPVRLAHIRKKRGVVIAGFVASNALLAVASMFILSAVAPFEMAGESLPELGYLFAYVALSATVLGLLGLFLRRLARARMLTTIVEARKADPRPPILFLRSFRDDQVAVAPPALTLLGKSFDFWQRKGNLDVLLYEDGTDYGPVVAIGNPRDPIPPYGAARGYFESANWQNAVAALAEDSRAIVLCLDDTTGVAWEVEHIAAPRLAKTLLLMHPKFAMVAKNASFLAAMLPKVGFKPHEVDELLEVTRASAIRGEAVLGLYRGPDATVALLSSTFSRLAYAFALRCFFRGVAASECGAPPELDNLGSRDRYSHTPEMPTP